MAPSPNSSMKTMAVLALVLSHANFVQQSKASKPGLATCSQTTTGRHVSVPWNDGSPRSSLTANRYPRQSERLDPEEIALSPEEGAAYSQAKARQRQPTQGLLLGLRDSKAKAATPRGTQRHHTPAQKQVLHDSKAKASIPRRTRPQSFTQSQKQGLQHSKVLAASPRKTKQHSPKESQVLHSSKEAATNRRNSLRNSVEDLLGSREAGRGTVQSRRHNTVSFKETICDVKKNPRSILKILRPVAAYLRHHKLFGMDPRSMELNEEGPEFDVQEKTRLIMKKTFTRHFPRPMLQALDVALEVDCKSGLVRCLVAIYNKAPRMPFGKEVLKSFSYPGNSWYDRGKTTRASANPLRAFTFRVTASYFLCWYTLKQYPLLQQLSLPCPFHEDEDLMPPEKNPLDCAFYAFCPDPCCGWLVQSSRRRLHREEVCRRDDRNPCFELGNGRCRPGYGQNDHLHSLIKSGINVTCPCTTDAEEDGLAQLCQDGDACHTFRLRCSRDDEEDSDIDKMGIFPLPNTKVSESTPSTDSSVMSVSLTLTLLLLIS